MKKCGKCKEELPENMFFKSTQTKDGLYNACKKCHQKRTKSYRKNNRLKNKEGQRDYYKRTLPQKMLASARKTAKNKDIPFDLELSDIVIPEVCPILNTPFEIGKGKPLPTSASLDKIVPSLGYVKGNVQVISHLANSMKSNATPEQLRLFSKWIQENYA